MKKVYLLGDSFSVQYRERVRELLAGECEAVWPGYDVKNDSDTVSLFWNMRFILEEGADAVHWNTGFYDLCRVVDDGEPLLSPEQYLYMNRRMLGLLRTYTDRLVWATTIPAGEGFPCDPDGEFAVPREQWNREIRLNNALMTAYLKEEGVRVNDLASLAEQNPACLAPDGISLSEAGIEAAAGQTAEAIRAVLA